jgi:membrane fusion protein, multidrug efflux system
MKTLPLALAIAVAVAALSVAGCKEPQATSAPVQPPVYVKQESVKLENVALSETLMGQLRGSAVVSVKAKVSGYVAKKVVTDGQLVNKGDVLFELEVTDYALSVDKAKAQVLSSKASLALAETEFTRVSNLYANKAISEQDVDSAKAARDVRRADYQMAVAALKLAEDSLADTKILAPFDGVVSAGTVNVGDLVQAQSTELITVSQLNPLWVEIGVSEQQYTSLFGGAAAHGKLSITVGDKTLSVPIDYQSPGVDPQQGTIQLRASLPNADYAIRPGSLIKVKVEGQTLKDVATVPQQAVLKTEQGYFVYVNREQAATLQPITAGQWVGDRWLIEEGLNAGDAVITSGLIKLRPGVAVTDQPPSMPADGVAGATKKESK